MRDVLAPPADIEIVSRQSDPVNYGRYLVDVYYRIPSDPDWTSLADMLLAMGYAEPYPSPA